MPPVSPASFPLYDQDRERLTAESLGLPILALDLTSAATPATSSSPPRYRRFSVVRCSLHLSCQLRAYLRVEAWALSKCRGLRRTLHQSLGVGDNTTEIRNALSSISN
jgi:hypothetical protein